MDIELKNKYNVISFCENEGINYKPLSEWKGKK